MTESTINRINYHIAKAKAEILDEMIAEKKAEIERSGLITEVLT